MPHPGWLHSRPGCSLLTAMTAFLRRHARRVLHHPALTFRPEKGRPAAAAAGSKALISGALTPGALLPQALFLRGLAHRPWTLRARASRTVVATLLLAALPSACLAAASGSPTSPSATRTTTSALVGQRALYDLSLAESGGNTLSASGNMTYVVRDTCSAWSTQQHLDIQSATRNGGAVNMVSDYTTLESKDGRHLVFRTVQKSNNAVLQVVSGEASIDALGHGVVEYEKPIKKTLKLPNGTLFPMAHTAAILAAAQRGAPSIAPLLFDGTGPDGAQETYITLLGWGPLKDPAPSPALAGQPAGRVHVAFFGRTPDSILPDYEIGMRYFANGVSDMLDMDFGDFRMRGTLHSLTLPPRAARC